MTIRIRILSRVAVMVTSTVLVTSLVGAAPANAAAPSFAKTVTNALQKAHATANAGSMKVDTCLTKLARRAASKAVKSGRVSSRGALQRKANRVCKVTGTTVKATKTKSASRAAKSLRKGLKRQLARPTTNRLGVATKRANGRRITVVLTAARTPQTTATPTTPAPAVPADFVARARAEFVRLVNVERVAAGVQPMQANACLDGVAQSWAEYIATIHTMDHNVGAEGKAGYERCAPIPAAQLKYSAFNEIIAGVTSRNASTPEQLAASAVASFNGSVPHRTRMLVASVGDLGTGIAWDAQAGYWKLVAELADYSPR